MSQPGRQRADGGKGITQSRKATEDQRERLQHSTARRGAAAPGGPSDAHEPCRRRVFMWAAWAPGAPGLPRRPAASNPYPNPRALDRRFFVALCDAVTSVGLSLNVDAHYSD